MDGGRSRGADAGAAAALFFSENNQWVALSWPYPRLSFDEPFGVHSSEVILGVAAAGWVLSILLLLAAMVLLPLYLRRTRQYLSSIKRLEKELVALRNMPFRAPAPLEDLPDEPYHEVDPLRDDVDLLAEPRTGGATHMSILLIVAVSLGLLVAGVLLGRYYIPDTRPLKRAAKEGAMYIRGLNHVLAHDNDAAIDELTKAVSENTGTVDTYFALGVLFRERGEYERAVRVHQSILIRADSNRKLRLEARFQLGLDFESAGYHRRAQKAFEQVLERKPKHRPAAQKLLALYEAAEQWERAFKALRRVEKIQKSRDEVHESHLLAEMGLSALQAGQQSVARKQLRQALNVNPEGVHPRYAYGVYLQQAGKHKAAAKTWVEALESAPDLADFFFPYLEETYFELDQLDQLANRLDELLTQHPENPHLRMVQARFLGKQDPQLANTLIRGVLEDAPSSCRRDGFSGASCWRATTSAPSAPSTRRCWRPWSVSRSPIGALAAASPTARCSGAARSVTPGTASGWPGAAALAKVTPPKPRPAPPSSVVRWTDAASRGVSQPNGRPACRRARLTASIRTPQRVLSDPPLRAGPRRHGDPMPSTSDFKRGLLIELDGDPVAVEDFSTQTPSARGAATLVKAKLRNLRTKQLVQKTFKAGERFKEPDYEVRSCQYLYDEGGEIYYFMDDETYEQWGISRESIEYELGFIRPNDACRAVLFEGQPIGLQLPNTVVLEVAETEPAVKGDTVTNVTKAATLETGLEVQVPLFVATGDKLTIDTRDARYIRRANPTRRGATPAPSCPPTTRGPFPGDHRRARAAARPCAPCETPVSRPPRG